MNNQKPIRSKIKLGNTSLQGFPEVPEDDLHLLLKYFISVVPRAEQVSNMRRRRSRWTTAGSKTESWQFQCGHHTHIYIGIPVITGISTKVPVFTRLYLSSPYFKTLE